MLTKRLIALLLALALLCGASVAAAATLELRELWPMDGRPHDPKSGEISRDPVTSWSPGYGEVLRLIPPITTDTTVIPPVSSGGFVDASGHGVQMPVFDPSVDLSGIQPTVTSSNESVIKPDWSPLEYPHVLFFAMQPGIADVTVTDQRGDSTTFNVTVGDRRGTGYRLNDSTPRTVGTDCPFYIQMPHYVEPAFTLMNRYATAAAPYAAEFISVPMKAGHKMIYRGSTLIVPEHATLTIPDRMIWSLGDTTLRINGTLVVQKGGYLSLFSESGGSASLQLGANGRIQNDGLIAATAEGMFAPEVFGTQVTGGGQIGTIAYESLTWAAGGDYDPMGDGLAAPGNVTIVKRPLLDPADATALNSAPLPVVNAVRGEQFELLAWSGTRPDGTVPPTGAVQTLPQPQTVSIPCTIQPSATYWAIHKKADGFETLPATPNAAAGTVDVTVDSFSPYMLVYASAATESAVYASTQSDPPAQYTATPASGGWRPGMGDFSVRLNAPMGSLVSVLLDGQMLPATAYSVSGDTLLLSASYMQTLSQTDHTLRVQFTGGSATSTFTVTAAVASVPATGLTQTAAFVWFLCGACCLVAQMVIRKRRREQGALHGKD